MRSDGATGSFNSAIASGSSGSVVANPDPQPDYIPFQYPAMQGLPPDNSHSAVPRLAIGRDKIDIKVSVFCCTGVGVLG